MATVTFEATFSGGVSGFAEFTILQSKNKTVTKTIVRFEQSGKKKIDLDSGVYGISLFGLAPATGAKFKISAITDPTTPISYPKGPIMDAFSLII